MQVDLFKFRNLYQILGLIVIFKKLTKITAIELFLRFGAEGSE